MDDNTELLATLDAANRSATENANNLAAADYSQIAIVATLAARQSLHMTIVESADLPPVPMEFRAMLAQMSYQNTWMHEFQRRRGIAHD